MGISSSSSVSQSRWVCLVIKAARPDHNKFLVFLVAQLLFDHTSVLINGLIYEFVYFIVFDLVFGDLLFSEFERFRKTYK